MVLLLQVNRYYCVIIFHFFQVQPKEIWYIDHWKNVLLEFNLFHGATMAEKNVRVLMTAMAQGDFLPGVLCDRYDNVQLDLVGGFQMLLVHILL